MYPFYVRSASSHRAHGMRPCGSATTADAVSAEELAQAHAARAMRCLGLNAPQSSLCVKGFSQRGDPRAERS